MIFLRNTIEFFFQHLFGWQFFTTEYNYKESVLFIKETHLQLVVIVNLAFNHSIISTLSISSICRFSLKGNNSSNLHG